ncbi:MAG: hypothetical protein ACPHER_03340 [Nevskiales bacterium]
MLRSLLLAATVAILAGLWIYLKPQPAPISAAEPEQTGPIRFEISIAPDSINGPSSLQVTEGDEVEIHFASQVADEVHLHGYDLHQHLEPGKTTVMTLTADRSGRFEMELHKSHRAIGNLEVYPAQ